MKLFRQTKRLVIRPLELRDFENWRQAFSSLRPAQTPWDETNWKASELTRAKFKQLLLRQKREMREGSYYNFAVFRADDGIMIGNVSLMEVQRGPHQSAYLGYRILNPFWRQGFATEACRGVIELAFRELKLHRLEAGISPSNRVSLRVARRLGMRREGVTRNRLYLYGAWQDLVLYAVTSEDRGEKFRFPVR